LVKLDNVDAKFLIVEYMIKGAVLQRDHIRNG